MRSARIRQWLTASYLWRAITSLKDRGLRKTLLLIKEERYIEISRGIRVSGIIHLENLSIGSENMSNGYRYEAVNYSAFKAALALIDEAFFDFTFVDLGSGKGFALILAADHGFKKLIGVDFAAGLVEECRKNLVAVLDAEGDSNPPVWEITHGDVTTFEAPVGNVVFFIFNPFDETILRDTFTKIRSNLSPNNKTYVVYVNAKHRDVLDDLGFKLIGFTPKDPLCVYRNGIAVYRA